MTLFGIRIAFSDTIDLEISDAKVKSFAEGHTRGYKLGRKDVLLDLDYIKKNPIQKMERGNG